MSNFHDVLKKYRKDIIDFLEGKVKREVKIEGGIIDSITNLLAKEFPYSDGIDNAHRFLALSIISSYWCGWFSQARTNSGDEKFDPEYVDKFKEVIDSAYNQGRDYAQERP